MSPLEKGGVLSFAARLVPSLDPSDTRITLVYGSTEPDAVREALGDRVEHRLLPELLQVRRAPARALRRVAEELRRRPFDILHSHSLRSILLGVLARPAGMPHVATIHGELNPPWKRWTSRVFCRLAMPWVRRGVDRWIAVSRASADDASRGHGIDPARTRVIYPGIESPLSMPSAPRDKRFVLGCLSRLAEEKGIGDLLHAIAPLQDVACVIGGEGPQRRHLERLCARLGLLGRVRFVGWARGDCAFWSQANAIVLPSRSEGMPQAMAEAMAFGRPVVAARVGGIPEIVRHGEEGLLVPARDRDALREAVRLLAGDRGLAARMGARARERAKTLFEPERAAQGVLDVYAELSSRAPRTRGSEGLAVAGSGGRTE